MDELLLNLRISLVIGNRFRLGVLIKVPLTPDDNSTEFPSITTELKLNQINFLRTNSEAFTSFPTVTLTPLNRTKIKQVDFLRTKSEAFTSFPSNSTEFPSVILLNRTKIKADRFSSYKVSSFHFFSHISPLTIT